MDLFLAEEMDNLAPRDVYGESVVVVNAVTPGFCKLDPLARENAPWTLKAIQALVTRTVEEGSKTLLHAVTQGVETRGRYLDHEAVSV